LGLFCAGISLYNSPEGMTVFLGSVKVFPSHIYVIITVTICFLCFLFACS
jgi:hypothetical protein